MAPDRDAGSQTQREIHRLLTGDPGFAEALAHRGVGVSVRGFETSRLGPAPAPFIRLTQIVRAFVGHTIERIFPHRDTQRLFRIEWREDLFYYLVSSMMVQALTFLAMAPQLWINAHTGWFDSVRGAIAGTPWPLQFVAVVILSDLFQYGFHRAFHRVPFLWGFHAVHHSAKAMDWLAGARMHFIEIVLLRDVTSLPLLTLGFLPSVMQAYIGLVYVWSSLLHANLRGDFNRLGHWLALPRFHHWHHALDIEGVDKNFAIHFPWIDKLFGTYYYPQHWPEKYGLDGEEIPSGFLR